MKKIPFSFIYPLFFCSFFPFLFLVCENGNYNEGDCTCNKGWTTDENGKCTKCDKGFYSSEGNCKSCPPACESCDDNTGKCNDCPDDQLLYISKGRCKLNTDNNNSMTCDPSCDGCYDVGPRNCLSCVQGLFYVDGSCVADNNGKCLANDASDTRAINYDDRTCDRE